MSQVNDIELQGIIKRYGEIAAEINDFCTKISSAIKHQFDAIQEVSSSAEQRNNKILEQESSIVMLTETVVEKEAELIQKNQVIQSLRMEVWQLTYNLKGKGRIFCSIFFLLTHH